MKRMAAAMTLLAVLGTGVWAQISDCLDQPGVIEAHCLVTTVRTVMVPDSTGNMIVIRAETTVTVLDSVINDTTIWR